MKVFTTLYDGTEVTTKLKVDGNLYQEILKLKNLKSLRIAEKLKDGGHYAGAYDFIEVKCGKISEQLCFITPLVSDGLAKLIDSLYKINVDEDQKKIVNAPTEFSIYKSKIIPLHKISNLPLIELPPPPMMQ
ncbi:hypothetical protein D3C80_1468280 [compost metagenome]